MQRHTANALSRKPHRIVRHIASVHLLTADSIPGVLRLEIAAV